MKNPFTNLFGYFSFISMESLACFSIALFLFALHVLFTGMHKKEKPASRVFLALYLLAAIETLEYLVIHWVQIENTADRVALNAGFTAGILPLHHYLEERATRYLATHSLSLQLLTFCKAVVALIIISTVRIKPVIQRVIARVRLRMARIAQALPFLICLLVVPAKAQAQTISHYRISQRQFDRYGYQLYVKGTDSSNTAKEKAYRIGGRIHGTVSSDNGNITVAVERYNRSGKNDSFATVNYTRTIELRKTRKTFGDSRAVINLPYHSFYINVGTMPFQYRLSVKDGEGRKVPGCITSSLSLCMSAGYTMGFSRFTFSGQNDYSLTAGALLGISGIEIKGSTARHPETWAGDQTTTALSYGVMIIAARNNLGLMISLGMDNVLSSAGKEWIYNNKPWIGLGISTSILH